MAFEVIRAEPGDFFGATIKSGEHANIMSGNLVGLDSNGEVVLAENRAASTIVRARGYAVEAGQFGPQGALVNRTRLSIVKGGIVRDDSWNLTPGAPVYTSSGGAHMQTRPTTTGDLRQIVGFAPQATQVQIQFTEEDLIP